MGRQQQRSNLTYAIGAWAGITVATLTWRFMKRQRNRAREEKVAKQGGLLPSAKNVIHALELRSSSTKLALESASGETYSWREYWEESQAFAKSLVTIDNSGGVAVHSFNQPKWFFATIGALAAGWTLSGIYLTNTYDQAVHILKTSEVKVLVLEDEKLLETTYQKVLNDFPKLTVVLLSGGSSDPNSQVLSYSAFLKRGSINSNTNSLTKASDLPRDAVTTLVYTSGTTGNPKAVELTHSSIHAVCTMMHARVPLSDKSSIVSYLPLSHIAAMGIDLFSPIYCGGEVHFADANALRGSLRDTLVRVRPTLFFGVPRVWEKMAIAMRTAAGKSYAKPVVGTLLKTIGTAAKATGATWWSANTPELVRCSLTVPFGFFKILAFRKVRKGCGLDRCQLLYTGAAPLSEETTNYFRSLDMPLLEVFGMSESCGTIAVCGPYDGDRPIGTCGRPLLLGNLEIAPDGEILWKGDNNMSGYKGLPDATAEAISPSTGQLHTGDVGVIDSSGYLRITGRKKDIIITAGGENVAPIPIEDTLMTLLKGAAGHVLLIGDRRKFLTILIAPNEDGSPVPEKEVEKAIETYNTSFAKSRAQRVQRAHVLETAFGVTTGELTPTMKVKRAFVTKKFSTYIDAMYADSVSKLVGYSSMNIGEISEVTTA